MGKRKTKEFEDKKEWQKGRSKNSSNWSASGIEPDAGVEPATLRLRVSRSTD
jgi:hypothetical protein